MWTKSCGITIQMKPLQWYFYMVLLFFSISQIETENFFFGAFWTKICGQNQIMQCDHSNETCFAVFSPGTFYFSALYKVKLLCASLAV